MLTRAINTIFIERVGNGGFIIRSQPPEQYLAGATLAAVTSLDEAMSYIRTEVWPPAPPEVGDVENPEPESINEGFLPWDGGVGWPEGLQASDFVDLRLRNGGTILRARVGAANWESAGHCANAYRVDIVGYRPVE